MKTIPGRTEPEPQEQNALEYRVLAFAGKHLFTDLQTLICEPKYTRVFLTMSEDMKQELEYLFHSPYRDSNVKVNVIHDDYTALSLKMTCKECGRELYVGGDELRHGPGHAVCEDCMAN